MGDSAHNASASASRQEHALMGNGVTADAKITDAEEWHSDVQVLYKVDETPPWSLAVLFAFQVSECWSTVTGNIVTTITL